jgi:hypothetical protein
MNSFVEDLSCACSKIFARRLGFSQRRKTSVRGADDLYDGNYHDHQHDNDVDAKTPEQDALRGRKSSGPKMSFAFGRDYLVRLKQRKNHSRIFQIGLRSCRGLGRKIAVAGGGLCLV